jgi:hypothetical protein
VDLQGGVFDQAARAARQREIAELNQAKLFVLLTKNGAVLLLATCRTLKPDRLLTEITL